MNIIVFSFALLFFPAILLLHVFKVEKKHYFAICVLLVLSRFVFVCLFNNAFSESNKSFFYSKDQIRYIGGTTYVFDQIKSGNIGKVFDTRQLNKDTHGNLNGTTYKIVGGIFYLFLNEYLSPLNCLILINHLLLLGNAFLILKIGRLLDIPFSTMKGAIGLYLVLPMTNFYSMVALKEMYATFLVTLFIWVYIITQKKGWKVWHLITLLFISYCIFLDRWFILVFLYIPVSLIIIKNSKSYLFKGFVLLSISGIIVFIVYSTNWYTLAVIYRGFQSNMQGIFSSIPLPIRIVISPLIALKFLLSPNFISLSKNIVGERSSIVFVPYFYQFIVGISFVFLIIRFFSLNAKVFIPKPNAQYVLSYKLGFIVLFFLLTFSVMYSSANVRIREQFMPAYLVVVAYFLPAFVGKIFSKKYLLALHSWVALSTIGIFYLNFN